MAASKKYAHEGDGNQKSDMSALVFMSALALLVLLFVPALWIFMAILALFASMIVFSIGRFVFSVWR